MEHPPRVTSTVAADSILSALSRDCCLPETGSTVNRTRSPVSTRTLSVDGASLWGRSNQSLKSQWHSVGEAGESSQPTGEAAKGFDTTDNFQNSQQEQPDEAKDQIKALLEQGKQTMDAILSTLRVSSTPSLIKPPLTEAVITKMVQEQVAIMLINITAQAQNYTIVDDPIQFDEDTDTVPAPDDTSKAIVLYNPWSIEQVLGMEQQGKRKWDDGDLNGHCEESTPPNKKPYSGRAPKCNRCPLHHVGACPICRYCRQKGHFAKYCRNRGAIVVQTPQPQSRVKLCYACKSPDHLVKDCPQMNQWPVEPHEG